MVHERRNSFKDTMMGFPKRDGNSSYDPDLYS